MIWLFYDCFIIDCGFLMLFVIGFGSGLWCYAVLCWCWLI